MPNRTLTRIAKKFSTYYYYYGKSVASRTYCLLAFSLSFISYFSFSYITKSLLTVVTPTTHNNIPLSQISTSLDAQCWHASAHVQFNNFTSLQQPSLLPSHYLITERLRLSHPDQPVTFDLIQQAKAIYTSITTTLVIDPDSPQEPVSLENICYQHEGHCLVHAPPFNELNDEKEWKKSANIHNQPKHQYEQHPYSIYSNTTFDFSSGDFIKADAVLLTFVLKQTQNEKNSLRIWNHILQEVKEKYGIVDIASSRSSSKNSGDSTIWYASANTSPQMIQYKFNLFPYELSYKVQITIVVYIVIFYLVSMAFGKSNLVKSGYTFGLAAVFLSIACFTTTSGIFIKLGISLNSVPWYLLLLSVNIGSLENVFLLTNAVLYAGCDMIVKEKVSRGLQSVGVPMTVTLIAELFILSLGTQMDTALIKEFCRFTRVALCVDYLLEMTFVIGILSIDIKRVELADLDDRQMSKRLHELKGAAENDGNQQQEPDFCPVQDTPNKDDSKSCADCKDFKTHRVLNALMLCFIVLTLTLFCSTKKDSNHQLVVDNKLYQPELNQLSDQFWSTVNPEKDVTWLQINPPHLFIYDQDSTRVSNHVEQLQQLYLAKSMVVRHKIEHRPSLFRQFILSSVQNALIFLLHINVPLLMLCLVTVGIITWMTPKWRDQWLLPLMTHAFNQFILTLIRWFPSDFIKRVHNFYFKGQPWYTTEVKEYDADGIHHRGAISVQNIFNQQHYRSNVKQVQVRTLMNHHVADIQNLDANAKQSLVSCGQDGRIVLWNSNSMKPTWMARLDKLSSVSSGRGGNSGVLQATLNPDFFNHSHSYHHHSSSAKKKNMLSGLSTATITARKSINQKRRSSATTATTTDTNRTIYLSKNFLSKPRCVRVDQGNKWIAAGYEDGMIRVWNVGTGTLVREMELHPHLPSVVEVQQEISSESSAESIATSATSSTTSPTKLRNRFNSGFSSTFSSFSSTSSRKTQVDRILSIQFIGVIAEYCHPLVAEAAARSRTSNNDNTQMSSQNFLVSAHKSGTLHEWDILSGECIQTIKTGHTRDITQLHVVDSKTALSRKLGVTWVFTASKDGTVKCWERVVRSGVAETATRWTLAYTIEQQSGSVTSIATELPVGGMGVLVTGCSDGSVRVWNFETGESVCTLSLGKGSSRASSAVNSVNDMGGGPIRKFSKFSASASASASSANTSMASTYSSSSFSFASSSASCSSASSSENESDQDYTIRAHHDHRRHHHHNSNSNHKGAISQVVVTRYCEVENGPGLCRGCDTCFGNGFLVASSSMDNKVHAWRLERADKGHEGSCTLCTKDYHRKQYKHRKAGDEVVDSGVSTGTATGRSSRRRRSLSATQQQLTSPTLLKRQRATVVNRSTTMLAAADLSTLELLDIEQLAGDADIPLKPTFLGKIDQPAGRGVVFCDKILAGVRRRTHRRHSGSVAANEAEGGEWETWFASLQYYDPSSEEQGSRIPIETFNLDKDTPLVVEKTRKHHKEDSDSTASGLSSSTALLKSMFTSLFSSSSDKKNSEQHHFKYKRINAVDSDDEDTDHHHHHDEQEEEDTLEASENLPFSAVRHIIPLDGSGLACDFGNFIKLIYLDKMSLTEKERIKQTREVMELATSSVVGSSKKKIAEQVLVEEEDGCQCENGCSPATKGMGGYYGSVNKEKNGGQCCKSGNVKKIQQEKRRQKDAAAQALPKTCGGVYSTADCSLRNNCSRASNCTSAAAHHTNTANYAFSN